MQNLHPTSTASDGRAFRQIRFQFKNEPSETNFIPCPHCGWRNDSTKVSRPAADGSSNQIVSKNIAIPGGTRVFKESIRTAGCANCGLDFTTSSYRRPFFSSRNFQGR